MSQRLVGYGVSQVPTNGMLGGMAYQDPINVSIDNITVGGGSLTGTADQRLQVNGGAYVSGSVGIGTTNPESILHVYGNTTSVGQIIEARNSLSYSSIELKSGIGTTAISLALYASSNENVSILRNNSNTTGAGLGLCGTQSSGADLVIFRATRNIVIGNNPSIASQTGTTNQKLQVQSGAYVSGSVGVGVTNPLSQLHIGNGSSGGEPTYRGNIIIESLQTNNATNGLEFKSSSGGNGYGWRQSTVYDNAADIDFYFQYRSNNASWTSTPVVIKGVNGNLGIGTINPTYKLESVSSSSQLHAGPTNATSGLIVNFTDTAFNRSATLSNPNIDGTGGGVAFFIENNSEYTGIYVDNFGNPSFRTTRSATPLSIRSAGDITLSSGNAEKVRITSTGNVLVGSSSSTGTASQLLQVTGGAYVSGSVGIGTTNPQYKLHVIGDTLVSGVITATTFFGNLTGYASTAGISTNVIGGIGSITQLQVTGISTFTNGPVLVGAAISTGTTDQRLQVTGGAYVSGNIGIGTTNPTTKLAVQGDVSIASTVGIGSVISITPYNTLNSGTLSFDGSSGQLFSITNNLTSGSIFSVNDISGIPSIDVDANGTIQLATYGGKVGIGTTNPGATLNVVPTSTSIAGLFSGTTSSDMVRITQEGTGNALVVEDSTNPDSTPFVVTGIGSVGIGTINPLSITHVEVPNALSTSTAQGLYVTNSSSGFTYPTTPFTAHPGIYNNLRLDTSQTINSVTPGGFNFVYGLRNLLILSASSTSTDLTRLYTNAIQSNVSWASTAPTTQITGLTDNITFGGSSISFGSCAGTFSLSGISTGTQTATTITSPTLTISNFTSTNRIRNVTTWRGVTAELNIGQGAGAGNTTTITTAEYFSNSSFNIIQAGGTGSVTNITNLYGLRLATPSISGIVTITNNWGISQEWSNSQNYFAGNVLVGAATSTGTASQKLQVTGGAYVSGNLGVGVTAPGAIFDVLSNIAGEQRRIRFGAEASNTVGAIFCTESGGFNRDFAVGGESVAFYIGSNGATTRTERARIDSSGRLGLGTSTPATALDVNGSINFAASGIIGSTKLNITTDTTQAYYFGLARNNGDLARFNGMKVYNNANGAGGGTPASRIGFFLDRTNVVASTERLTITEEGRVGIGTTSPGVALHVDGDIRCDGVYGETDTNTSIQFPGSDVITFNEGGSEAARIDSSGRLLVGTSSAPTVSPSSTARLVVSSNTSATSEGGILALAYGSTAAGGFSPHKLGQILFTDSTGGEFGNIKCEFDGTAGLNDYPGRIILSTTADGASSPTEAMRINNQRELLIGTTTRTANGGVLQVSNGITFPATAVACTDANTLDDYEEGTWTPSLGGTATYNFQSATYTKVGRQVVVNCYLDVASIGTGSANAISGLPFTVGTFAPSSGAVSRLAATATNVTSLQVQLSSTTATTVGMTAAGNMATQNVFGNGTAIYFTAAYFV
jgi:hypothetical protein